MIEITFDEIDAVMLTEPVRELEQVDENNARPLVETFTKGNLRVVVTYTYRDALPSPGWAALKSVDRKIQILS